MSGQVRSSRPLGDGVLTGDLMDDILADCLIASHSSHRAQDRSGT